MSQQNYCLFCFPCFNWTQRHWNTSLELEMHLLFSCLLSPSSSFLPSPILRSILKLSVEHMGINGSVFEQSSPVQCSREGLHQNTSCYICWQLGDTIPSACFPWGWDGFKHSHSQVISRSTSHNCSLTFTGVWLAGDNFSMRRGSCSGWLDIFSPFYLNTSTEKGMLHLSFFYFNFKP